MKQIYVPSEMSVKYYILIIQVISRGIHRNLYRTPKIIKFMPKFKLKYLYHGKYLVPPVNGMLLGLMASFLRIKLRL
jgi:hypothetical protein